MILSSFKFLVSTVTHFWPKHNKCLEMGSKCQIFTSLRTRITIFSDLYQIMVIKEFQEMWSFSALKMHPMTFKPYKC